MRGVSVHKRLFSSFEEYRQHLVCILYFFQGVCSGVVRGSGRQRVGVVINFISFCMGLPLGITLMFYVFREGTGWKKDRQFNN